ncbi:ionotropic receptor 93a-like [Tigriopus californicus]|uniref:ionotropic receptor 93a-like n=1 Tax=Tigriopus californicus TaxID=6832 RepID=UPI0027D9D6D5|nr:ionotropic receptor 93a-like [Tigriopus californicus]
MFDNRDFDYTYPHGREGYCFATRNPTESSEWDVILKPFTLGSWMLLVGTVLVSLGFLLVLAKLFPLAVAKPSNVLLTIYGSCIAQSRTINPSSIGAQIFLADFMIISNLLSIIYSGALFSSLAVNSKVSVMNTLMEMVQSQIEVGGIGTGSIDWFVSAENEAYRELAGRYTPYLTLDDAMEAAKVKPMNVVNSRTALEFHLRSYFTNAYGEPEFRIMDECWINYPISYLLPKNSAYTDSINRKLFQLRESGLVDDLITREMDKMSKMNRIRNLVASQKVLTLTNLYEPFLILIIGLGLASIAFICECASDKIGSRRTIQS